MGNVEFRLGDAQTLEGIEDGFDAVIGRLVLMYLADPVAALRRAATRVRPGGLICIHDGDVTYLWASPQTPLWSLVHGYVLDTLEKAGIQRRMGPALFTAFRAAGLPGPRLLLEPYAEGGPEAPAWAWANMVSAVIPLMERLGVATRSDIDPATLADRLLTETLAHEGCVISPLMTGACVTLPR